MFLQKPQLKQLDSLETKFLQESLKLKTSNINFLQQELFNMNIEKQIRSPKIQNDMQKISQQIISKVCSDLPTTFWNRK